MSDTITLSEKYGVNPSMCCCFWCGEPKGIALLGKLKGDIEAPRNVITDYEPCDKCEKIFSKGIHVIGVSYEPIIEGLPPIGADENGEALYPDTNYFVARKKFIRKICKNDKQTMKEVIKKKKMLMLSSDVRQIVDYIQQEDSENESG